MEYFYVTQTKFQVRLCMLKEKYNSKKGISTSLEHKYDENGELVRNLRAEEESMRRAKRTIVDYALTNDFEYFGTLTFDDRYVDVHSYDGQLNALDRVLDFFNNYKRTHPDLKYILVPEYGKKKGRLHFHFVLAGISKDELFINERKHLDFMPYRSRFGFTQFAKIGNSDNDKRHTAFYISKYITKNSLQLRSHRYFCSHNLRKPTKYCLDDYSYTVAINEWLEEFGFTAYYENALKCCKCFSVPMRVFKDLCKSIGLIFINGVVLFSGFRSCYEKNPFEFVEKNSIISSFQPKQLQVAL